MIGCPKILGWDEKKKETMQNISLVDNFKQWFASFGSDYVHHASEFHSSKKENFKNDKFNLEQYK